MPTANVKLVNEPENTRPKWWLQKLLGK